MKTLKRIKITFDKVTFLPNLSEMKENVIYISDKYGVSGHKCICGCGELTIMPLWSGEWTYQIHNRRLSMQPSIGNYQMPCKSHYIIEKSVAKFV